jgi:plasmid replication initiation protein
MGAVAFASVIKDGEPAKLKVQLLGANIEQDRADGYFYYRFPPELLEVFKKSEVFARLKTRIMYAFNSKYALRLYEVVQKRVNLKYKQFEDFTESEMRGLLGVPKGKLKRFADLNKHAIKPAVEEVNFLGEYMVMIQPIKEGRRVAKLRLVWLEKDRDSLMESWKELDRAKVGRKARMKGTVEEIG